jgi:hypothetical protein
MKSKINLIISTKEKHKNIVQVGYRTSVDNNKIRIITTMTEELFAVVAATSPAEKTKMKESKSAEKKKNKKRKSKSDDIELDKADQSIGADADDKNVKAEGKSRLQSKKEEKEELLKKVPTKDKDGMAYTKLQIRRMMKRVKKGLPPVPTPRELEESKQAEARLKREEESLYAGEATHNEVQNDSDDDDDDAEEEGADDDDANDDEVLEGDNNVPPVDNDTCTPVPAGNYDGTIAKKKAKRSKTVPSDYVCSACKNRNTPAHWIYDCPDKVTVRGANKKKKKDRGVHDPDSKKVFVSGLPFEANAKKVEDFFSTTHNCGIVSCVGLIKFDDSKRCNGQAYVTFNTDEGAKLALELTGITINAAELSSDVNDAKKKKKNGKEGEESDVVVKRKELKLKVSKVRNRNETKPQVRSYTKR